MVGRLLWYWVRGINVWNQGEGCWMILGVGLFHLVIEVEGLIQEHGRYAFEGFLVPIWSKKVV